MASKKKLVTAGVALATAAALMLGGTFAWQSINQTALNEASDVINPGGRLHDDFDGTNKDIYVENFTDPENGGEDIYARIRLEEYFEVVMNYGTAAATPQTLVGSTQDVTDESVNIAYDKDNNALYERVYATYKFDGNELTNENGEGTGIYQAAVDEEGFSWWKWTPGSDTSGEVYYMPTFNLNKDSLLADTNGAYVDAVGGISDRDDDQYTEYVEYAAGDPKTGYEIYDGDVNDVDELSVAGADLDDIIENGTNSYPDNIVLTEDKVSHTAKTVGTTKGLISMSDWLSMRSYDDEGNLTNETDLAGYWVYDTDGWVYWSAPIPAGETTGLLLDGIELGGVMDDTWYYAINVVAQFVTADDVGKTDATGFYDTTKGDTAPTTDAAALLETIGVDMSGEAATPDEGGEAEDEEGSEDETKTVILMGDEADYNTITVQVNERFQIDESGPYEITYVDDSNGSVVTLTADQFIEENQAATITDASLVGKTLTLKNTSGGNGCYVVVESADSTTDGDTETPAYDYDMVLTTAGTDSATTRVNWAVTVTIEDAAAIDTATLSVTDADGTELSTDSYVFQDNSDGNYILLFPDETYEGQTLTVQVSGMDDGNTYKGTVSIIQPVSSEDNVTEETSSVASIIAAYEVGTDDGSGNVTYEHQVYNNPDFDWKALNVSAYDAEGTLIDSYSDYTFTISDVTVTSGYTGQEESSGYFVYQEGVSSYAVWIDPNDGYLGISGPQSDDEVPVNIFGEDLTVTYTLTVADRNGTASTSLNMTVNIDVEPETEEEPMLPEEPELTESPFTVAQNATADLTTWDYTTSNAVITMTAGGTGEEPASMYSCNVQFNIDGEWIDGTRGTDYDPTGTSVMTIYANCQYIGKATQARVHYVDYNTTMYTITLPTDSSGVF